MTASLKIFIQNNTDIVRYLIILVSFMGIMVCNTFAQDPICPEIEDDVALYELEDCDGTTTVCYPISLANVINDEYEILVNGDPYSGSFSGCMFDSTIVYSYFTLLGQGTAGPYHMESWTVNGVTYSGQFEDIDALVDSLNTWDPTGEWVADEGTPTIQGGNLDNEYSDMVIEQLQLPGTFANLGLNYGQTALGTNLEFGVGTYEVTLTWTDGACSDVQTVHVACLPDETLYDTIYLGLAGTTCLNTGDLLGTPGSLTPCETYTGSILLPSEDPSTNCVSYLGQEIGEETLCYVICDDLGFCDTTYVNVVVELPPAGEIIIETILLGQTGSACLDTELDALTMFNDCPDLSGDFVQFFPESGSTCFEFIGLEIGTDTACIVICDESSVCDTIIAYVSVIDATIPLPSAVDDIDTTFQNNVVTVNVMGNDTIDFFSEINIVDEPAHGSAMVNFDNTITYEPDEEFCGEEVFTYEICNLGGCDTAQVTIMVLCDEIRIYNGFSPNQDGLNDRFRISGIEAFPNVEIKVFNVWGNLVFANEEGEGYQNETGWDGTWKGQHLPDGDYFYHIILNDGSGKTYTGNLLITR